ncbi:hypothetical protein CHUAL_006764 [Chamberlinius hualienensis]
MASKSVEPNGVIVTSAARSRTPSLNLKPMMDKFDQMKFEPGTPPELGPLPTNWEKAYTDNGEPYFIDHTSGTSQWLDPRLARVQKKSIEDCEEDELPYGWEKIDDPQFGTYYIDHINRQTQYENPVIQARRIKSQHNQPLTNGSGIISPEDGYNGVNETLPSINDSFNDKSHNLVSGMAMQSGAYPIRHPMQTEPLIQFTRNPAELRGTFVTTTLVKGSRGFGFTIVGGDDEVEEFLQIKSVVQDGPAWQDGKLAQGDVLVYVDDVCVLGFTHRDVVMMFQNLPIGDCVTLEVCRGYPLPFDPDDPNTEIVTTLAVSADDNNAKSQLNSNYDVNGSHLQQQQAQTTTGDVGEETPDILDFYSAGRAEIPLELLTVGIVKGLMGFGFTIADSAHGQKVKKILDRPRCKNLAEGDVLLEINGRDVRGLEHSNVVQILKDCSQGLEATITIQRGGQSSPNKNKAKILKMAKSFEENSQMQVFPNKQDSNFSRSFDSGVPPMGQYRSKTPTADIYGGHREKEVVPIRSKTPSAEIHNRSKSPLTTNPVSATAMATKNIYFQNEMRTHNSGNDAVDGLGPGSIYGTTTGPAMRANEVPEGWQSNRQPTSGNEQSNGRYQEWPPTGNAVRSGEESCYGYSRRDGGEGSENYNLTRQPNEQQNRQQQQPIYEPNYNYSQRNNVYTSQQLQQTNFVNSIYGTNMAAMVDDPNLNHRRQGTSFEREQPSPVTNVGRKTNSWYGGVNNQQQQSNLTQQPLTDYLEFTIHLFKQETGFGFRIVGGTEEGSQVSIGHIVPGGAADLDGRLKSGDEIVSVDNQQVLNTSHHHVVQLMGHAAQTGRVTLGIRRKIVHQDYMKSRQWDGLYPYDVTVNRRENEGFGFVIISSVTRAGSTIGRIIEGSPAERCGCLHVGDRILAVNGKDINDLHHGDIVNLIKDSGFSVTLTIGPPQDDASSTTSTSQKLVNAYAEHNDSLIKRNIYNSTPCLQYNDFSSSAVTRRTSYAVNNFPIHIAGGCGGGAVSFKQINYIPRFNDTIQEENVLEDEQYYAVELFRGTRGFGFSIRGGKEFQNMPLFVLKIADDGPAAIDGRLKTGDQFVEINGVNTKDMTHAEAIDLIKQGGSSVRLLVKRSSPKSSSSSLPKHSSHSAVPLSNDRVSFDSVPNQSATGVVSPVIAGNLPHPGNYMLGGSSSSTSANHLSPLIQNGPLGQSSPRVILSNDQEVYYPYWQYERGPV